MKKIDDIIILGAGPSGSIACKTLEDNGLKVRIIDKSAFPREKPCGGIIPWRIHEILHIPDEIIERPLSGYKMISPSGKKATMRFPTPGAIIDRSKFDDFLVKRLETAVENYHVVEIKDKGDYIYLDCGKEMLKTRFLIAADGANSLVRKSRGIEYPTMAMGNQFLLELSEREIQEKLGNWFHIYYTFINGYGWITPLKNYVKVGIGGKGPHFNRISLEGFISELSKDLLKGARKIKYEAHMIPMAGPMEKVSVGRILFAGDAGGFVYPGTGEGIYFGMKSGNAAGNTVSQILENDDISHGEISEIYLRNLKNLGLLSLRDTSFMEKTLGSRESTEKYVNKIKKLLS